MKPKCKLCGSPHWTYEEHTLKGTEALQKVGAAVLRNTVTKVPNNVTTVTKRTPVPTLSDDGEGASGSAFMSKALSGRVGTPSSPSSPSVGRPKKHKTNAERQRAYRERSITK